MSTESRLAPPWNEWKFQMKMTLALFGALPGALDMAPGLAVPGLW